MPVMYLARMSMAFSWYARCWPSTMPMTNFIPRAWSSTRQARGWHTAKHVTHWSSKYRAPQLSSTLKRILRWTYTSFYHFPYLFLTLLFLFPCFSFLKPSLVWFLSKVGYFRISNLNSFHLFPLNCMSLSLNFLHVYFWFFFLETPYVSYLSRLWPNAYHGCGQPQPMTVTTF